MYIEPGIFISLRVIYLTNQATKVKSDARSETTAKGWSLKIALLCSFVSQTKIAENVIVPLEKKIKFCSFDSRIAQNQAFLSHFRIIFPTNQAMKVKPDARSETIAKGWSLKITLLSSFVSQTTIAGNVIVPLEKKIKFCSFDSRIAQNQAFLSHFRIIFPTNQAMKVKSDARS